MKDKLKNEYVEMLNKIGLKWSVHERRPISADPVPSSTPSTHSDTPSTHSSGQETPKLLTTLPESKPVEIKPAGTIDSKPESKSDSKPEDAPESKPDEKDVPEIPPIPDRAVSGGGDEPLFKDANIKIEDTGEL